MWLFGLGKSIFIRRTKLVTSSDFNNNAIALSLKIVSRSFLRLKVLDTFCLKKAIAFIKQNTRTDGNIP